MSMGLRFRKSIRAGNARINLSKSGVGFSYGVKGLRYTKKSGGGSRVTASVPGTGVSYVKDSGSSKSGHGIFFWLIVIAFFPIALSVWFFRTDKIDASKGVRLAVIGVFVGVLLIAGAATSNFSSESKEITRQLEENGIHIQTDEEFEATHSNFEPLSDTAPSPAPAVSEVPVRARPEEDEPFYVFVTPTGSKYHRENCRTIQDSTTFAMTIEEAIEKGFEKCGVCTPAK